MLRDVDTADIARTHATPLGDMPGTALAGFRWTTGHPARAVLQLAHGAGEHAGRYRERLAPLMDAGFVVYAADHRGHGLTSGMSHVGDFGPGGAEACIRDMAQLSKLARTENPGLPPLIQAAAARVAADPRQR